MRLSAQVLSGLQERLSPNLYNHLTADDDTGYYYSLQVRVWWQIFAIFKRIGWISDKKKNEESEKVFFPNQKKYL